MAPFDPFVLSSPPMTGVVPVDPMLAVWIILGSLVISALAIFLASAPPSSLLRHIRFSRPTTGHGAHSPARA